MPMFTPRLHHDTPGRIQRVQTDLAFVDILGLLPHTTVAGLPGCSLSPPLLLYGYPYSPIPIPSTVYKVRDTSALPSGISETTGSFLQLLCPTWGPFHSSTLSTPLLLPVSNPSPANLLFTHFTSGFFSTTCSPFRSSKSTFCAYP